MNNIALNSFVIKRKAKKRVGRGVGSGRGVKCGAGDKGQAARSGTSFRRLRAKAFRRFPKIGFSSQLVKPKIITVKHILETMKCSDQKVFDFSENKLIGIGEISAPFEVNVKSISIKCKEYLLSKGCKVNVNKELSIADDAHIPSKPKLRAVKAKVGKMILNASSNLKSSTKFKASRKKEKK